MPRFVALLAVICAAMLPTTALAQDKFFDSNGVRLRYVEQGQGQPIVLLHGKPSNPFRSDVEKQLIAFTPRERAYFIDNAGYYPFIKPFQDNYVVDDTRRPRASEADLCSDVC